MKSSSIALRPFLDTIQTLCRSLSKEEMVEVLIRLALRLPSEDRRPFLTTLESSLPENHADHADVSDTMDAMLDEFELLKERIQERMESIEDGSYWEDPDEWDHDAYLDEDPDIVSEEQLVELASFFQEAGDLFVSGRLQEARDLYAEVFDLVETIAEHDRYFVIEETDLREERARYGRCVYETTDGRERLDAFFQAMNADASDSHRWDGSEAYPRLQDVVDAMRGEMSGFDRFLADWKQQLEREPSRDRTALLLLETVHRLEGIAGVARLARQWRDRQPLGYLFWLEILNDGNDPAQTIAVAAEALDALDRGNARERVARYLEGAAEASEDDANRLRGKRERWFSRPADENLLALVEEADRQKVRKEELEAVSDFFSTHPPQHSEERNLQVKTLLMAGNLNEALTQVEKEQCVGWSQSGGVGTVFGAVLSVATDHSPDAGTVQALFREYADQPSIYSGRIANRDESFPSFADEIRKGLLGRAWGEAFLNICLGWAEEIGKARVDHIVSHKHRNAYDRAARVLCALAETWAVQGDEKKAETLLRTYYAKKYNRFSAFRREVKSVVAGSRLLRHFSL